MWGRLTRAAALVILVSPFTLHTSAAPGERGRNLHLSGAGELAQRTIARVRARVSLKADSGVCVNEPDCGEGPVIASETQSETSIAVDATGQHVVIGFNDFRGFDTDPGVAPL